MMFMDKSLCLSMRSTTLRETFVDNTTIMSTDTNPTKASKNLQIHLNLLEAWPNKRKIVVSTNYIWIKNLGGKHIFKTKKN